MLLNSSVRAHVHAQSMECPSEDVMECEDIHYGLNRQQDTGYSQVSECGAPFRTYLYLVSWE